MKTLKPFILVSLLLFLGGATFACGPYYFSAADSRIYHILPPEWYSTVSNNNDFCDQNVLLWSSQTGCKDTAAIRKAIYDASLTDWKWANKTDGTIVCQDWFKNNSFVRHLLKKRDHEALHVLYKSKEYESLRNQMRSPWYYNSQITNERKQIESLYDDLVQRYSSRHSGHYDLRQAFLLMKVSWASGHDTTCLQVFDQYKNKFKGTIFEKESKDYAARSLAQLGRKEEADELLSQIKPLVELIPNQVSTATWLRRALRISPNDAGIVERLQSFLTALDRNQAATFPWEEMGEDSVLLVVRSAISNPQVLNKDAWRYAAACILDYQNKPKEALAILNDGDGKSADDFLRSSTRILTFYLRAKVNTIDDQFEAYAIEELKWLNQKLDNEWKLAPEFLRKTIHESDGWMVALDDLNDLYYYSAMSRIVLADSTGLAWRMVSAGRGVRALQMANVASNYILKLSDNQVMNHLRTTSDSIYHICYDDDSGYHRLTLFSKSDILKFQGTSYNVWAFRENSHDYSNGLFTVADIIDAQTLDEYRQRQLQPKDAIDRWFNERGYTNGDYWHDIIGTHYMRERNYSAAVGHLKKVSSDYQRRMNICFCCDPFNIDQTSNHDSTHYKLHFAQRMDSLQNLMLHGGNADSRGLAMLKYSIGLENSIEMCWYLTSYDWGCTGALLTDAYESDYGKKNLAYAKQLRNEALLMLRSDDAKACYYVQLGKYQTARKKYPNTPTCRQLALVCDDWGMYFSCANRQKNTALSFSHGPILGMEPYHPKICVLFSNLECLLVNSLV